MIIGIGNDICDIKRIEQMIDRFGDRFISRIFTEKEIAKADKRKGDRAKYISTFAKAFAAKEAFMKALGTGYAQGIHFKKIGVINDKVGKPMIELENEITLFVDKLANNKQANIHLTITDEYPYAFAVVVIEVL